jgi:hypothetical protein
VPTFARGFPRHTGTSSVESSTHERRSMASDERVPTADAARTGTASVDEQAAAEVRVRRERLRAELINLEEVLSGPTADAETWTRHVRTAAEAMRATLRDHVHEAEAPDGLLAQVARDAPWLEGRLQQLRAEHEHLAVAAAALVERCDEGEPQRIRDDALALLQQVSRHRQLGTDLLYEAYLVDISAAD